MHTGRSYYSQNELLLTFGLGKALRVARVEIIWPSGTIDGYQDVPGDTTLHAVEGQGAREAGRPLLTQWQGTRPVKLGRSADAVAGGAATFTPLSLRGAEKRRSSRFTGNEERFGEVEICVLAFEAWAQTLPRQGWGIK